MKFALLNPNWDFKGSTYFGCQDPHTPLELLFAADQLRIAGHESLLIDAQMDNLSMDEARRRLERFAPDFLVIPTAPSYLFWRCPPPELRVPMEWFAGLQSKAVKVAIGPHPSATPAATIRKIGCDVALRGEPDQILAELASKPWHEIIACCFKKEDGQLHISPTSAVADMFASGPLDFKNYNVEAHWHRHHVFTNDRGLGAELEFARGCPWACTFCNKTLFRNKFRERSVDAVLQEVDTLIARGVQYIYFIDEIFGVGKNVHRLLEGIAERSVKIGFQTRIDLWNEETLDLLGRAHCISVECGVESITHEGREDLNKNCRLGTDRIAELLVYARGRIPWVQANLILTERDDRVEIHRWQEALKSKGVWVSEPVPMFPFPGSPLYTQTFAAAPDDMAWERAHRHYTSIFAGKGYSDIQEQTPLAIEELETCIS
ncbi:MAG TPA: TIGR04295 family B12-binding domain-containing radical SAM protein [Candidatus Polarisedimenticolia bacterium]|nr:TIGR04295 family B12-binding domain-containing radical SAM protein [Candidatus Polarisedimenticolia bacterium]